MKPSIPKGTRDFSPEEVAKRNYIFDTIKQVFETYGFQPIETPSFENSDTLMGKYGEEGDRLIFKILNSGDFLRSFNENLGKAIKRALYDLRIYISSSKKEFDPEIYSNLCIERYTTTFRLDDEIKFDEDNINLTNLAEDIWFRISEIILKNKGLYKKLISSDKFSLTELTNFVFADFYFQLGTKYVGNYVSEKALRYDLTVPFARYVVQHQHEIEFPFKRYQMQPVWRADRPQKGRFREFYQCDADVVGSNSLWQEVEFIQLYDAVFTKLGLTDVTIKLNNRKILSGIAEMMGAGDKLIDFTVALDKLDKIGEQGVIDEMHSKGITADAIEMIRPILKLSGSGREKLKQLKGILKDSATGKKGVEELEFVLAAIDELGLQAAKLEIDVTLARGLNYYTGAIFEVKANKVAMGSIGGGGRYDDLTGIFGLKDLGGIGISFGLDRIYLVLEELGLFKAVALPKPTVLFLNFGDKEAMYCMKAIKKLRESAVRTELYPENVKVKKQLNYANKREIPFVVFVGENEVKGSIYSLKNMVTGEQKECNFAALMQAVKNH